METSPPQWLKLQVPGFRLLLYRFDIEPESYAFYVTDLNSVWCEDLAYQQIIERADDCTTPFCGIDPKQSVDQFRAFLDMLAVGLAEPTGGGEDDRVLRSIKLDGTRLNLTLKITQQIHMAPEASQSQSQSYSQTQGSSSYSHSQTSLGTHSETCVDWSFFLTSIPKANHRYTYAFQTIVLGLAGIVDAQGQQISDLMTVLRQKDFHLRHLREEYHDMREPRIHREAFRQFVPAAWQADWKARRDLAGTAVGGGQADVDEVVTRAVTEYGGALWGYHAFGRHWTGSTDAVTGSGVLSSSTSLPVAWHPELARSSLAQSSPPPAGTAQPNYIADAAPATEAASVGDETTASEEEDELADLPQIKPDPLSIPSSAAATPLTTYLPSSSPLRSPQKRRQSELLSSEPPTPSPKKRAKYGGLPALDPAARTGSGSLVLDLDSKRKSAVKSELKSFIMGRPVSTASLQSSSVPTATAKAAAAAAKEEGQPAAAAGAAGTEATSQDRQKELQDRLAGKNARQRPKRRF